MLARLIEASEVSTSEGESITGPGDASLRQDVYLPLDEIQKIQCAHLEFANKDGGSSSLIYFSAPVSTQQCR